jgi:transcriptional regulator GlxA family with amidase domain
VAGCVLENDPRGLAACVRRLAFTNPPSLSTIERVLVRQLAGQTLARAVTTAGVDRRAEVMAAFLEWERCDVASDAFFDDLRRLAAACAEALETARADRRAGEPDEPRVSYVLDVLAKCFRDPRLSLKKIAVGAGLSVWHATRLVKRYTGVSFTQHLHRVRIRAARDLLQSSRLTVKEIAYSVGYTSSTQLGRHFKQIAGTNPMTFRRRTGNDSLQCQESPINSKD